MWEEVSEKRVREKASQVLRDAVSYPQEGSSDEKPSLSRSDDDSHYLFVAPMSHRSRRTRGLHSSDETDTTAQSMSTSSETPSPLSTTSPSQRKRRRYSLRVHDTPHYHPRYQRQREEAPKQDYLSPRIEPLSLNEPSAPRLRRQRSSASSVHHHQHHFDEADVLLRGELLESDVEAEDGDQLLAEDSHRDLFSS